jgi:hypothetical protein
MWNSGKQEDKPAKIPEFLRSILISSPLAHGLLPDGLNETTNLLF